MIQLVCLGRVTLDLLNLVDHFPTGDDLIRVIDSSIQGGGPVGTAAAAAARMGVNTAVIDCLGDDWRTPMILDGFRNVGVSIDYLQLKPGHTSTQSVLLIEAGTGKRAIINARGNTPPPEITPEVIDMLKTCQILHVTGTYPDSVLNAIGIVKNAIGKISFDGGAGLFKETDLSIIGKVDWCICAEEYGRCLTGEKDMEPMLQSIARMGPEIVGITSGECGSFWLLKNGDLFHQPAFPVHKVIDTTGCGDSFHGGFLFAMLHGYSPMEAARFASAVAAINAQTLGGRDGLPDFQTVQQFIHSL